MADHEAGADHRRRHHDMGGLAAGPVEAGEHDYVLWEMRVDALMVLLSSREPKLLVVDELRNGIEQLGAKAYEEMTYYERWIASITSVMLKKGVITTDELGRKMAEIEARAAAEAEA